MTDRKTKTLEGSGADIAALLVQLADGWTVSHIDVAGDVWKRLLDLPRVEIDGVAMLPALAGVPCLVDPELPFGWIRAMLKRVMTAAECEQLIAQIASLIPPTKRA